MIFHRRWLKYCCWQTKKSITFFKCKILYLEYNKVGDLYLPCIGTNCIRMCGVVCMWRVFTSIIWVCAGFWCKNREVTSGQGSSVYVFSGATGTRKPSSLIPRVTFGFHVTREPTWNVNPTWTGANFWRELSCFMSVHVSRWFTSVHVLKFGPAFLRYFGVNFHVFFLAPLVGF